MSMVAPEWLRAKPHRLWSPTAYILGGIFTAVFVTMARCIYDISWDEIIPGLLWSNLFGFICALTTIRLQWVPWFHKYIFTQGWKTWVFFLSTYIGLLLWKIPFMRGLPQGVVLFFPLWFTNWIITPLFGEIQDKWVKWAAKKGT